MHDPIRIGQLTIRFLIDRSDSKDSMALFELTVPPGAKVPAPHYHSNWDETVYGLEGSMSWTLSGDVTELAAGGHLFIPRGAVHHFINRSEALARALVMIAPGVLGSEYFRDLAALMAAGSPPDLARVGEVMARHGLVPVPG